MGVANMAVQVRHAVTTIFFYVTEIAGAISAARS